MSHLYDAVRFALSLNVLALASVLPAGCQETPPKRSELSETAPSLPPAGEYAVDPTHTFVYFAARHQVVGTVRGRFDKFSGRVTVSRDPGACAVDVSIEAASVSTQNSERDQHLRSPDFFDSAKYPVIRYQGRGIRKSGDGWEMLGTLSVRGVEREVPLKFTFKGVAPPQPGKPNRVAFRATADVRRADFGMTHDLLAEIGKPSANPDVWLEIDAELLESGRSP